MREADAGAPETPDASSHGFVNEVDPLRYDGQPNEPNEVVGVLCDMVPEGARVLDVGCGTGSVSLHLVSSRSAKLIGVEPDSARASRARERGLDVRGAMLTPQLISELGPFDIVLFADVLEHLADPASMLDLAKTALGAGGRIVASVPNVAHWSVRTDLVRGRFNYHEFGIMDATHLRWFTEATLRGLFAGAGLPVERLRVTAGVDLPCYYGSPWRQMGRSARARFLARAIKIRPRLFGCQLVVRSSPWAPQAAR